MFSRSLPQLIIPIFFFTLLQTAQPQTATPPKPAASAPSAGYSDQPFIFEKAVTEFRRENDGTGTTSFFVRAKVISESGVQALGLLSFPYDNFAETLQVESVRVFKADGTVVNASLDNAQDIASAITREAPMYSDNRERHIPVPNLRPGDSVEYKYVRILTSPAIPGQFWIDDNFIKQSVVLDEEIDIDLPADREVKFKTAAGIVPSVSTAGARKVYRLHSKNLTVENEKEEKLKRPKAPTIPEEKLSDVELSSFLTWKALADWYFPLQHEKAEPTK